MKETNYQKFKNIKRYDIGEMLTENIKLKQNQTQLAITELEKVKDFICDCTCIKEPDYTSVRRKIDNQIKKLKGE